MAARKVAVRFATFPRTQSPPSFTTEIVRVFEKYEQAISTIELTKGLTSDKVLQLIAPDLLTLGFQIEEGKTKDQKIDRPVLFGDDGIPTVRYQIDGYHPTWECVLQVEAGRAWMGNAVYKDLLETAVMVDVKHLCLAVPNTYKYQSGGSSVVSRDYDKTRGVADALFGHTRLRLPYDLILIGY